MSTEQEHEIVPAIRDWLTATSGVEIPFGLSRKEARGRARKFLAAILAGTVVSGQVELDDDLNDVLWASVEDLDERPPCQLTFEECDDFYQFVAALRVKNDFFQEHDEVLHRVARIGWRSASGGLLAALEAREAIWKPGDEHRHREVCETADQLPGWIKALEKQQTPCLAEVRDICARLWKLSVIHPTMVAATAMALATLLTNRDFRIGRLDDREHLKAASSLAAAVACRNLGKWDSARSGYAQAAEGFRRTAEKTDLDRVEVELLALHLAREDCAIVAESAPTVIEILAVPRDKLKAQLILAQALINLDRPQEARSILEGVRETPAILNEPSLHAFLFTRLGTALSYLGEDSDAIAAFAASSAILKRFSYPLQLADLTGTIGEHFRKLGKVKEAITLFLTARAEFERIGQAKFVGYYSVLAAELMVLLGRNEDAESELLAALPLIEEFDLREEAVAAVALLRESFVKRRTDVTTIRRLRDQIRKGLF